MFGGQPHLDPLPVSLLHDLEHHALVEVRLREDQLVGPDLLEHERELRARAQEPEARHGLGSNDTDELVREAATRCLEGALQAREALSGADENDASPDAHGPHHLERRRLVGGAEQPDRHCRDEHRRRDESRRREVVARPEPEREHDERDDDEAGEDPARPRAQLPLTVQACLREHEDGDRCGKLEPFRRAFPPQEPPEDVALSGDDLANDEGEVDPQRETDEVEDDEHGHRERTPEKRRDRPPRKHVGARGSDVTARRGLRRRRRRRFRRRSGFRHAWKLRAGPRRSRSRGEPTGAPGRRANRGR